MGHVLRDMAAGREHEVPRPWQDAFDGLLAPVRLVMRTSSVDLPPPSITHLGYLSLLLAEAGPSQMSRTPRHIARSPAERVAVALQQSGTAFLTQDGRSTALEPGETVFIDPRRPFALDQRESFRMLLVSLPRQTLGDPADHLFQLTGRAVTGRSGVAALLIPFLERLSHLADQVTPATGDLLAGNTVEFIALLADELLGRDQEPPGDTRARLVPRVRDYIDRHLGDADLTPERVAAAHYISVRYLHRLFEGEGTTVGRLILRRRVEECARELSRRGRVSPTVSTVARRWGFQSPAHFSRAFKGVFGVPPRQWRLAGDLAEGTSGPELSKGAQRNAVN
ncbi:MULTISPECIES: helix-turn-helix domain-containing protein [Streptomyces]|uniref:Helix-turn-helix domain-containing protein n=1 Tax=Streptomyces eurythermus TaxID=42237 RepID=A0ABW6Z708_9ACTN|nr:MULTISPECIES: helix-turn-helix domain-containing protein [Streptomyces]